MPPLDDAARFPALAPADAGCRARATATGAVYDCRGRPGDGADYDAMAPADQTLVTQVTVNAAKAIAAYVRQLRCGPGRFDAWLDGDAAALGRAEQRGAALFVGKAGCAAATAGPNLTDHAFHNVGLQPAHGGGGVHRRGRSRRGRGDRGGAGRSAERARRVQRRRRRAPARGGDAGAGGRVPHADAALPLGPAELHAHRRT